MAGSDTEERTQPAWRLPSTLIGAGESVEVLMCKPFGYMVMCVPSFIPHLPSSELVVWYLSLSRGLLPTTLLSRITALSQGRNHCDRVWGNQHLCLVKLYIWGPTIFWTNFYLWIIPLGNDYVKGIRDKLLLRVIHSFQKLNTGE